jgi:3-phenylpropionate/trans-cinnamate dioxygenase ferredoxin reductase subunit
MPFDSRIVVVGGGHAAGQLLVSLRKSGHQGPLTLVAEESSLPYQRPPLSKAYLAGEMPLERIFFRPEHFYKEHDIETRLGVRAERINRKTRSLELTSGETLDYDKLALTTGARVRTINVPGSTLKGLHYLRTLADVDAIKAELDAATDLAVVGGGFIGLEVAAVAAKLGKRVTVLEMQDRLMPRVVSSRLSAFYADYHRQHGVNVVTGAVVTAFREAEGRVSGVACADGGHYAAQLVIVGIGVVPNVELAVQAGLTCDNGIVVDDCARTGDPDIVAAGDCTNHPNSLLGGRLRLESVHNAVEQAKTAAATLTGQALPYAQIPWFWSDQFDLKLQMAGISSGYDLEVVRGEMAAAGFSIYYFRDGELIAIDSVNRPADHMLGRKLLATKTTLTAEQAANLDCDLKTLL